ASMLDLLCGLALLRCLLIQMVRDDGRRSSAVTRRHVASKNPAPGRLANTRTRQTKPVFQFGRRLRPPLLKSLHRPRPANGRPTSWKSGIRNADKMGCVSRLKPVLATGGLHGLFSPGTPL